MARGSTTRRGYGWAHQRVRKAIAAQVALGLVACARCHQPITPGQRWHLDHTDDRTGYLGPSHAACNVAARNHAHAGKRRARSPADPAPRPRTRW